jgi:hypothetical protein
VRHLAATSALPGHVAPLCDVGAVTHAISASSPWFPLSFRQHPGARDDQASEPVEPPGIPIPPPTLKAWVFSLPMSLAAVGDIAPSTPSKERLWEQYFDPVQTPNNFCCEVSGCPPSSEGLP